jgi:hypothetical protein
MPKGIHNSKRGPKSSENLVSDTIRIPSKVKANLTTKEKRTLLQIGEHEKSMMKLEDWCNQMLNKLNQI